MSRYSNTFETNLTPQEIDAVVMDFIRAEGFEPTVYNGENVWKKGNGILTAPQYVKVSAVNGHLTVEAFMRYAILPGLYFGESDLNGFYGWAVKAALKDKVQRLEYLLQNSAYNKHQMNNAPAPTE